jgi:hypothetical protein
MTDNKDDYVRVGETWRLVDRDCPDCGSESVATQGTIHDCYDCAWWEPVAEPSAIPD